MTKKHHENDVSFIEALAKILQENDLSEVEVMRDYGENDSLNVRVSRAKEVVQIAAPAPAPPKKASSRKRRAAAARQDKPKKTPRAEAPPPADEETPDFVKAILEDPAVAAFVGEYESKLEAVKAYIEQLGEKVKRKAALPEN